MPVSSDYVLQMLEEEMNKKMAPDVRGIIKDKKVAIAGLGGLGSNVAVMLARSGIGKLLIVDFDLVEPSNLNRQNYYLKHIGMPKADALKEMLAEINPFVSVEAKKERVTEENVKELFEGYDIVCEAFDQAEEKAMLVNIILEQMPETKVVSASGMAGIDSANRIKTDRKLKNLYVCGDFTSEYIPGAGIMAPRVSICAGHEANMILRLLSGTEKC